MVGATFRIEIDDKQVRDALAGLKRRALDMSPAMDTIGSMLVSSVLNRFETGVGPTGKPWKPSKRALKTGGQTLIDKGHLRDSITHRFGRDRVEVGTNKIYGAIHQFGGRAGRGLAVQMPARPFLGVDAGDKAEITNIVTDHIRGLN